MNYKFLGHINYLEKDETTRWSFKVFVVCLCINRGINIAFYISGNSWALARLWSNSKAELNQCMSMYSIDKTAALLRYEKFISRLVNFSYFFPIVTLLNYLNKCWYNNKRMFGKCKDTKHLCQIFLEHKWLNSIFYRTINQSNNWNLILLQWDFMNKIVT